MLSAVIATFDFQLSSCKKSKVAGHFMQMSILLQHNITAKVQHHSSWDHGALSPQKHFKIINILKEFSLAPRWKRFPLDPVLSHWP